MNLFDVGVNTFKEIKKGARVAYSNRLASNGKINDALDLNILTRVGAYKDSANNVIRNRAANTEVGKKKLKKMGKENTDDWGTYDTANYLMRDAEGDISATRVGIAGAATIGGLAVGGRFIAGGGWNTDSNGKKDLVGVPLI